MGGGGLRILPHKSWHVWNYDNRARVEKDIAQAKVDEEEKLYRVDVAEQEVRLSVLRGKASRRNAADPALAAGAATAARVQDDSGAGSVHCWTTGRLPQQEPVALHLVAVSCACCFASTRRCRVPAALHLLAGVACCGLLPRFDAAGKRRNTLLRTRSLSNTHLLVSTPPFTQNGCLGPRSAARRRRRHHARPRRPRRPRRERVGYLCQRPDRCRARVPCPPGPGYCQLGPVTHQ